MVAFSKELIK